MRTATALAFTLAYSVLLLACEDGSDNAAEAGDRGDAGAATGAFGFRCTLAYRESNEVGPGESSVDPKFELAEMTLLLSQNEAKNAHFGELTLEAFASSDRFEGSSLSLHVRSDDKMIASWLYQYDPEHPPANQFGSHGFTGLIYLTHPEHGGDYQFFCATDR